MPDSTITLRTRADLSALVGARASFNTLTAAEQQAERGALTLAQSMARLDARMGDAAGGAARLKTALQTAAYIDPKQATSALNQIISLEQKAAAESARLSKAGGLQILPRTVESFGTQALDQVKSSLLGIVGPAALVTAGFSAIRGSAEAAKQALDLREAQNALKAVSGSAQVYADALATARRQQVLFGGSLQDNIDGLQGLVVTSRDTGASLQALADLAARLNIKSPEQGIGGARVALQEAFSEGNITSLSRRFEIPKAALAAFKDESISTAEKVQILSGYLDSVGISSAAVAGKVDPTALAFRNLNAELEAAKLNAGGQLADAFARSADGLGRLVGVINGNPEAFAKLSALFNGKSSINQSDIDQASQLLRLSTVDASRGQAKDNAFARDKLGGTTANTDALGAAEVHLNKIAISSDAAAERVAALYAQFAQTGDIDAFLSGAIKIDSALQLGTKSTEARIDAVQKLRDALAEAAEKEVADAANKDAQSAATDLLAAKTKLAVDQFLALNPTIGASGAAAAAAAAGYDPQIRQLIVLAVEARNAQAALAQLSGTAVDRGAREFDTPQELAQGKTAGRAAARERDAAAAAKAKAADEARGRQIVQTGTATQVVTQRQREYNQAVKEFGANSKQAIDAQTNLIEAEQAAAKKGRAGRISAAESTALTLNDITRKSGEDRLRIERENLERLRDQQEDFDVKRSRSVEDFERQKRRLLAQGQKGAAARLSEEFRIDQQREQEDFDRTKRRTLRNNAEALGDQATKVDTRVDSVNARAAARGVKGGTVPTTAGGEVVPLANPTPTGAGRVIQVAINGQVVMDGKQVGQIIYDAGLREQIDDDLAIEFAQIGITLPNTGQTAVAGP